MKDILKTENGNYETTFTEKYRKSSPWVAKDPMRIESFIPGTITSIDVKLNDRVEKGDKLLMFNAMKMENTLYSPVSGVVKEIKVEINQAVPKGAELIILAEE